MSQGQAASLAGLERVMGIEPTLFAWEARVLPLNDTRISKPPYFIAVLRVNR